MLPTPMPKKDTVQFHIRPLRSVVNDLERLAKEYQRESANQVAVEILRDYKELWAAAEKKKLEVILEQTAAVRQAIRDQALRGTLHHAKAEEAKPTSKRQAR